MSERQLSELLTQRRGCLCVTCAWGDSRGAIEKLEMNGSASSLYAPSEQR